jgi:hypothetical protein
VMSRGLGRAWGWLLAAAAAAAAAAAGVEGPDTVLLQFLHPCGGV